jgi:hypothetical protein
MDHAEIRGKLSAYLDGAVTPREKSLIEKHLETCQECGTVFRELRQTVDRLRNLGEEEPPPWLTQRVMARIAEEAEQDKGFWRRLFLPLRWKLPVEAAALLFLSVTVYLVYRTVSPEVNIAVPPVAEIQGEAAPQLPPIAGPQLKREQLPEARKRDDTAAGREDVERQSAENRPAAAPPSVSSREASPSTSVLPPAPAPPVMSEKKGAFPGHLQESNESVPSRDSAGLRKEEKNAASPAMRAKALAPAVAKEVRLVLVVADRDTAFREIDRIAGLSGGATVRKGSLDDGGVQTVRVERENLGEFLERLGAIGEIRKKMPLPAEGSGMVDVLITVETVNRPAR